MEALRGNDVDRLEDFAWAMGYEWEDCDASLCHCKTESLIQSVPRLPLPEIHQPEEAQTSDLLALNTAPPPPLSSGCAEQTFPPRPVW